MHLYQGPEELLCLLVRGAESKTSPGPSKQLISSSAPSHLQVSGGPRFVVCSFENNHKAAANVMSTVKWPLHVSLAVHQRHGH
jgi:hypothetical protein